MEPIPDNSKIKNLKFHFHFTLNKLNSYSATKYVRIFTYTRFEAQTFCTWLTKFHSPVCATIFKMTLPKAFLLVDSHTFLFCRTLQKCGLVCQRNLVSIVLSRANPATRKKWSLNFAPIAFSTPEKPGKASRKAERRGVKRRILLVIHQALP